MEKSAHYFLVGIFMTVTIFTVVLFLIWLAGPHDERQYDFYTVEFKDSISGLEEGSNVQYKGVKVGKVIKMRLVPGNDDIVRVDIGVGKETPISAHTVAALETQGITGLVRIELSTSSNDREPPPTIPGEKYPILQGQASKLYKALEDLPEITQKILDITRKFDKFLDEETVSSLKQTVKNVENMSRDLNGLLSHRNVANASTALENFSISSEQMPEMVDHLRKTADQMDSAATNLNGILTRNRPHIDKFASEGLSQITATSREAKGTAASLRALADRLKDNPSAILYQPSSRGVEIPK